MQNDVPIAAGSPGTAPAARGPTDESRQQFREEIFPEELAYLRDRRGSHGLDAELGPDAGVGNGLVGLGLSGGGIRSATFNLGLLQALARHGLFPHIDYLSTVSGGGFIGSSLTALMSQPARRGGGEAGRRRPAAFPFGDHAAAAGDPDPVEYLRLHADYLGHQGLVDYLRGFALLARGIALNLVLLLPILVIVSLVGMFYFGDDLLNAARRERGGAAAPVASRPAAPSAEELLARVREHPATVWRKEEAIALTHDEVQGLQVWGLFGTEPAGWERSVSLWTGRSAVGAATLRPEPLQIAAAGEDGTLWLFYPEEHGLELRRESGRVVPGCGDLAAPLEHPLVKLHLGPDGLLTGQDSEGTIRRWVVGSEPARCPTSCPPAGDGKQVAGCPSPAATGWPAELPAGSVGTLLRGPEVAAAWSADRFTLPMTGWALVALLTVFVGLYPFAALLAGPLGRLAAAVARARQASSSLWLRLVAGRAERAAGERRADGDPAMAAARRVAGSVAVGLVLFAAIARLFDSIDNPMFVGMQRFGWPFAAFGIVGLWWVLSLVFLAPLLRRWKAAVAARTGDSAAGEGARPKRLRSVLLLLLPWGLLLGAWAVGLGRSGLASALVPVEPVWSTLPLWVLALAWWAAAVFLLAPLLTTGRPASSASAEQRREWHRGTSARLYVAANLALWIFVTHAAFHPLPADYAREVVGPLLVGFGVERELLIATLPQAAVLAFVAGLQFLLWKAFARLAGARAGPAPGGRRSARPRVVAGAIAWRERYEKAFSFGLLALAALASFEVLPFLVYHFHQLTRESAAWLYYAAVGSYVAIVLAAMFLQAIGKLGRRLVLACLGLLGPLLPALVFLSFVDALVYGERWHALRWSLFGPINPLARGATLLFLVLTAVVAAYLLGKLVDANLTGMHGYYRDRLSQAYLVGVDEDGVLGPEGELSLGESCREGSGAPYPLLNASLNMQRESGGAQRWRNSDFFVFSPRWCGGPYAGYCRTEDLEYLAPGVHLGSAMAVSGAAAAPNMGALTSGFVVMLMTLLNVRLGLWLPTPRRVARLARIGRIAPAVGVAGRLRRWWLRLRNRPSGYYLVKEMASLLDATGSYVNLSDGGHLENTGAYELLRRRCRFIVIGDGESDPAMQFGSLAALMRYAAIDLGVEIEMDLARLRPGPDGFSESHHALGTIRYPLRPGESERQSGRLLYVKASVGGRESEIIREYRARHPDFPHESTADQVFEEDQFEAYRALGFQIGTGLLAGRDEESFRGPADVDGWLAGLASPPATAAPGPSERA